MFMPIKILLSCLNFEMFKLKNHEKAYNNT